MTTVKDNFNEATEEQQSGTARKPDFIVYYEKPGKDGKKDYIRFGASWKHSNGDGQSIQLDNGGRFVIFPNRPK